MTNGDRIRQMSNEELVELLNCHFCTYFDNLYCGSRCEEGIKAYLESEVE